MPQVQIRPIVSSDFPALMQIDHQNKSEYVWQMDRGIEETQVTVNFREIRLPRSIHIEYPHVPDWTGEKWLNQSGLLAASLKDNLVGYIRIDDHYVPQTAWVRDLAVAVPARRQGIASVLLIAAQEWAAQRSLRWLALEMQSKNYPAIRMAFKLGFDFSGYNDRYYSNQDIALFFNRAVK